MIDFFDFLDNLRDATERGHYHWEARIYDRVSLTEQDFKIIIDRVFPEDGENYIYYIDYQDGNSKFNIPVYPGDTNAYRITTQLYKSASISGFNAPSLRGGNK